ncbi:MAG: YcxB family protein [Clostridiaceae bacterium]|jgi:hypothetical protein|nr:YcxB family protein [Clostridiaceae bacterium]
MSENLENSLTDNTEAEIETAPEFKETYKNTSKHSYDEVLAFNLYVIKKPRLMILLAGIFIALMGALIVILSVTTNDGFTWIGALIIAVGATFAGIALLFKKLTEKNVKKLQDSSGMISDDTVVNFSFAKDAFTSKTMLKSKKLDEANVDYSNVFKIVEDKDLIYIFISNNQALPLAKDGMSDTSYEEFKLFLKHKMAENGKPFVDYKEKK